MSPCCWCCTHFCHCHLPIIHHMVCIPRHPPCCPLSVSTSTLSSRFCVVFQSPVYTTKKKPELNWTELQKVGLISCSLGFSEMKTHLKLHATELIRVSCNRFTVLFKNAHIFEPILKRNGPELHDLWPK